MARSDAPVGRESTAQPTSKARWSFDSPSRPLSKYSSLRKGSKASSLENRANLNDAGPGSLHRESAEPRAPLPFPEYAELSPMESRDQVLLLPSRRTPTTTASGSVEKFDSTCYLSNDFAEQSEHRSHKSKHMKPKVHIKPMLRKLSREESASQSIDLSRSSTEQEGLGIYLNFERERERRQSDSITGAGYRRATPGMHNRSISGTSQFSTATGSSGGNPSSQFVYPLRPTPRSYSPPLNQSHQTSLHESDNESDGTPESPIKTLPELESHRTGRTSSTTVPRPSLQIDDDSFTRLPGISTTNVSGRPSFGYSRDNGSTVDTTSPSSRPSLDFVFRNRTRTSTDPVSRAATIQAARQAFEEKEAAKARRLEKQQLKAEERQGRRLVKRHSPEGQATSAHPSTVNLSEKTPEAGTPNITSSDRSSPSWKSQSKSTWVLFMTWLRTRVFKFRRKIRKIN
ncbi:hypothetical protein POX_b02135 [Penicillium oxalicum]|uniref:Uncharacterized protein n=1 Tax=Penicillium oxalicum (strain 114-2 / CGMCC 5302) TaxID=933388 RepID=S7ZJU0_PENO1|nr:hypothetical protein POX_b02135 [Penicillium oxalicum]EPS30870.1 hypothetical protein PDE_05822 [Penicillium oxalicum 114-2]KAI2792099.1 hypothetical protein POX_b02135 [Penicillium oxalicum]